MKRLLVALAVVTLLVYGSVSAVASQIGPIVTNLTK
jgi:hypothetical protein